MGRLDQVWRSRWAAVGAAVAVTLGAGGVIRSAGAATGSDTGSVFVPITPCRLFDTRPAPATVGVRTAPLTAGDTFAVPVRGTNGNCVIPAGATGVAMNVTIDNPTASSYLTVFPGDAERPLSSNLNWTAGGSPTPNQVTVKLGAELGDIKIYNAAGSVNVLADVVGYFTDHDHDDRYYTKAQVDTLLAAVADHDHDEVYYTKAQVDAMFAASTDDVWAYITAGGGIHAGSGNFTVTHPATGEYCVVVAKRLSHKAAQVTLADPGGNRVVSVGTGHGSACNPLNDAEHNVVPVYVVRTTDGSAVDGNFTVVVPAP